MLRVLGLPGHVSFLLLDGVDLLSTSSIGLLSSLKSRRVQLARRMILKPLHLVLLIPGEDFGCDDGNGGDDDDGGDGGGGDGDGDGGDADVDADALICYGMLPQRCVPRACSMIGILPGNCYIL